MEAVILIMATVFVIGFFLKHMENKREIERIKNLPLEEKKFELMRLQSKSDRYKTNHLLHFFISLFTVGVWVILWFFIAQSNASQRSRVNKMIDKI